MIFRSFLTAFVIGRSLPQPVSSTTFLTARPVFGYCLKSDMEWLDFFDFLNPKGFIQNPLDFVRESLAELSIDFETDLIFRSRIAMILIDFLQNFGVGLASLHDDFLPSSVILFVMQKNDIV